MSIPVLVQTYEETRRLAIAGSAVAPGDFRLKKLVPQLEQAGAKAPVFAKVAEAAGQLIASDEKTAAAKLMELSTLVNAILYTQGETGIEGELTPVPTTDFALPKTQTSARVLKPLLEALTSTGSGRLEIIRDAHERGAFNDLRLIAPALGAIDDPYSEVAEFVTRHVLPLYGAALLPELRATFRPKGRAGHVHRLMLMHQLDSEGTRPFVKQALDEGSKEVRVAAIGCLGGTDEDLPFLLEQAKAKAKEVRAAAFKALANSNADEAEQALCAVIGKADLELAIEPLRTTRSEKVAKFLLVAAEEQFQRVLGNKKAEKKDLGDQNRKAILLLHCLKGRTDSGTETLLLEMFAKREALAALKGEPSGKDIVEQLVLTMMAGTPRVQAALVDAHATLDAEELGRAFYVACRTREPAEVYKSFSPYLSGKGKVAFAKCEAIVAYLGWRLRHFYYDPTYFGSDENDVTEKLDPRWLDLAVSLERLDLVSALASPGHAKANAFLAAAFKQLLAKSKHEYEVISVIQTMIRIHHPQATDAVVELIKHNIKSTYHFYWVGRQIRQLPAAEAVPKLEALLPEMPEKMVDQLLDHITELKSSIASS